MSKKYKIILITILLTVNIGSDQLTKNIVRSTVNEYKRISIIDNYVTLTKVENTGAFLSLGNNLSGPLSFILLQLLPILALVYGLYYLFFKDNLSTKLVTGLSLIIGGGIGNIYDRIVFGSVTDFLHIDFVIFQTGIFNVADFAIMVGMAFMLIDSYQKSKKEKESANQVQ